MNLGIIGCGAIGTDVALAADEMKEIEKIYLQDTDKEKAINLKKNLKKAEIKPVKEFFGQCRRCIRSCITAGSR